MTVVSELDQIGLTRVLLGAAIGAVITALVGFRVFGWMFEKTANELAKKNAVQAVVMALAPLCVDKFQYAANAIKYKNDLKHLSSVEQRSLIEQGGWAIFPGTTSTMSSEVAEACAQMLVVHN